MVFTWLQYCDEEAIFQCRLVGWLDRVLMGIFIKPFEDKWNQNVIQKMKYEKNNYKTERKYFWVLLLVQVSFGKPGFLTLEWVDRKWVTTLLSWHSCWGGGYRGRSGGHNRRIDSWLWCRSGSHWSRSWSRCGGLAGDGSGERSWNTTGYRWERRWWLNLRQVAHWQRSTEWFRSNVALVLVIRKNKTENGTIRVVGLGRMARSCVTVCWFARRRFRLASSVFAFCVTFWF